MASGYAPFDEYHNEFRSLIREIEACLHNTDNNPSSSKDISGFLRQCEELLLQMKVEARGAPGSSLKRELMDIYQACQMQLASYQTLDQQKDELFSGRNNSSSSSSNNNNSNNSTIQNRLQANRDRVQSQNSQLENALKSIRETEQVAGEVGQELGRNRESIQRAQGHVEKLSGMMDQANGHLKSMMRKWF